MSKFSRGYSIVREKISKGSKFTMSCYNCEYYYKAEEDDHEVCQNLKVLKYDVVITDNNMYCNKWEMTYRSSSMKELYRKGIIP